MKISLLGLTLALIISNDSFARSRNKGHRSKTTAHRNVGERPFDLCHNLNPVMIQGLHKPIYDKSSPPRELPQAPLTGPVDYVLVDKTTRRLYALQKTASGYKVLKTYGIGIGQIFGPKMSQGDKSTPEGIYKLEPAHKSNEYHKSMLITYPNDYDKRLGGRKGLGSAIMLHGTGNGGNIELQKPRFTSKWGIAPSDWTIGCVSVTNNEIDELAAVIRKPVPIEICPDKTRTVEAEQLALEYGLPNTGATSWRPHNYQSNDLSSPAPEGATGAN